MAISTKLMRLQLSLLKPIVNDSSLEISRLGQAKMGELMSGTHKSKVCYSVKLFRDFIGEWIAPKSQLLDGVVLYLHGGGYVGGNIDYAKGFGTILSAKNGVKVFCSAYRLAPEHPFPAALDDALESYEYLLESGYKSSQIIICGESAGGGLLYALSLKLKLLGKPLPAGLIAISPWTDLTASGASYEINKLRDPSMTKEKLSYFAGCYTDNPADPFVSPLFGDLDCLPPSIIFVGGDEIMLDDSVMMHNKLQACGCESQLIISPEMWHGYVLYGVKEAKAALCLISGFIKERLYETA